MIFDGMAPLHPDQCVSAENFLPLCDTVYWSSRRERNPAPMASGDGSVIFCHTDHVFELFRRLRTKPGRYVVMTGESDHAVDRAHFEARPWNVVEWWGANATHGHPDCYAMPLGLADRTCTITLKAGDITQTVANEERGRWLYVNHRVETNPPLRQRALDYFSTREVEGWVTVDRPEQPGHVDRYLVGITGHKFICCPAGNGIDTHRMWEALYAQTIPVVLRNPVTEAFQDLPILIVDDFSQVDLPLLQKTHTAFQQKTFAWEKLGLDYWRQALAGARSRARRQSHGALIAKWALRKLNRRE